MAEKKNYKCTFKQMGGSCGAEVQATAAAARRITRSIMMRIIGVSSR